MMLTVPDMKAALNPSRSASVPHLTTTALRLKMMGDVVYRIPGASLNDEDHLLSFC